MRVRRKQIEKQVNDLLTSNNITTAPVDIGKIAKSLQLEIVKQDADDKISGMLVNDFGNKKALIGVNRKHHINRQRFTIAHEIGHFLLHHFQGVHFDGENTGLQINFRDDKSASGEDLYEREANLFAAELLMPRTLLEADISKIKNLSLIDKDDLTLKSLADKYKVSVRAITYRLAYLGYLHI
jgi:Zn-dependent peptidase ImmA (M78 family)